MNSRFKILAVDDDPLNIKVITSAFKDTYDVVTALSGHDAIDQVKEHIPDLILLDVMMPGLSGFDVCKIIKSDAAFSEIPIIFLTGLDTLDDQLQGLELGGTDYLTKPINFELLKMRIRNHIALKERTDLVREQRDLLARQKEELTRVLVERERQDKLLSDTEAIVRENERKLAKAFKASTDAISITSLNEGRYKDVNGLFLSLTGLCRDEIIGKTSLELNLWVVENERQRFYEELTQNEFSKGFEAKFRIKNAVRDVRVSTELIEIEGEKCCLNFIQDITERKQTEKELLNNERRMASLLNILQYPFTSEQDFLDYALNEVTSLTSSSIGYIYFYSEEKRLFTLNTWSKEVMIECSVMEPHITYPLDDTGIWGEAVRQRKAIVLNDYQAHHPLKKGTPEGHVHLKNFLTVPLQIDGSIVAVVGVANKESDYNDSDVMQLTIFMDAVWKITAHKRAEGEKKALEEQFQQTQKLESLGVLAGGIAHDFNNILTVIIGHCSLAKMGYDSAESHIEPIAEAAERAAGLCRQMFTYAGKAPFVLTQVNMTALVEEMLKMLKTTIHQNAVIRSTLSADIPLITGDASQLSQVVMNLIINAAEAIGDIQGEIRVSLTKTVVRSNKSIQDHLGKSITPGRYVCLEVSDNGCGMGDETRKRIFEPFYTTKFTGRGLGMSAVLGIITVHDGALQLTSQPGEGASFKVYLPIQIAETTADQPQQQSAVPPWHGSGMILLVEDEEQLKVIAKIMLNKMGFTVIDASNGKEALELYQRNAADITMVMTDLGMPVMDGYELFRELKERAPKLPIIISSGFGDAVITSRIPREETAAIIGKPYDFVMLRETLKKITESTVEQG